MPGAKYPKQQMHRIAYTKLTPQQIAARLAPDGLSASGHFHCVVETAVARALDCTLAEMAHVQGEGVLRSSERRVLKARYVKADRGWAIETLRFEPA